MASDNASDNTERYLSTLVEKLHTLEVGREERRRQEQHEAELSRKEELASRELALKVEMAERDRQFHALIQHLADSQKADSERLRAVEQEHTLAVTIDRGLNKLIGGKLRRLRKSTRLNSKLYHHLRQWQKITT